MIKRSPFLEKLPFAPIVAALFALVAIVLVAATPQWLFERWVTLSGLARFVPAAAPPLGDTARIAAALFAAVMTGGLVWLGLRIGETLLRDRLGLRPDDAATAFEASPTRPLFAENELGAPMMSDEAMAQAREELVLDTPVDEAELHNTFTPSFEPEPEPKVYKVEPYVPLETRNQEPEESDEERVEAPQPIHARAEPIGQQSIPTLLDRLDAAVARKPAGYRPDRSDLATLRRALGR